MIDYCFNVKGFLTLWSDFFIDNPASGRVMEKCGFKDTGELFVDSATDIARRLGVSDKFIAITILAEEELHFLNLQPASLQQPSIRISSFGEMSLVDVGILIASCVLLLLWAYSGRKGPYRKGSCHIYTCPSYRSWTILLKPGTGNLHWDLRIINEPFL